MSQFNSLFSPIKIGSMELPNRIVMAPMTVDYGLPDETPSDRQLAYYQERAGGGMAMIGLEVCSVDPVHRYQQHSLGLHSDYQIEGHRKLAHGNHQAGVPRDRTRRDRSGRRDVRRGRPSGSRSGL